MVQSVQHPSSSPRAPVPDQGWALECALIILLRRPVHLLGLLASQNSLSGEFQAGEIPCLKEEVDCTERTMPETVLWLPCACTHMHLHTYAPAHTNIHTLKNKRKGGKEGKRKEGRKGGREVDTVDLRLNSSRTAALLWLSFCLFIYS